MVGELEFERPITELKKKIAELKSFMDEKGIDLTDEITSLEERLSALQNDTYENMSAWDRVQVARHPERPTTLDYISYLLKISLNCMATASTEKMRRLSGNWHVP